MFIVRSSRRWLQPQASRQSLYQTAYPFYELFFNYATGSQISGWGPPVCRQERFSLPAHLHGCSLVAEFGRFWPTATRCWARTAPPYNGLPADAADAMISGSCWAVLTDPSVHTTARHGPGIKYSSYFNICSRTRTALSTSRRMWETAYYITTPGDCHFSYFSPRQTLHPWELRPYSHTSYDIL